LTSGTDIPSNGLAQAGNRYRGPPNLRFADDIVHFAKSAKELQIMLEKLRHRCTEAGLLINLSKTKIMTNNKGT
jgi:hypothetical protein